MELLSGKFEAGKNPFMVSGYTVRRRTRRRCICRRTGDELTAVALMAAGWDGNTEKNPGFLKDWKVKWEGILPMP